MADAVFLCKQCRRRSDAGEFKAGLNRMIEGLEQTGSYATPAVPPTNYVYFKCTDCGQKWTLSEDTSVRGPTRYLGRRSA